MNTPVTPKSTKDSSNIGLLWFAITGFLLCAIGVGLAWHSTYKKQDASQDKPGEAHAEITALKKELNVSKAEITALRNDQANSLKNFKIESTEPDIVTIAPTDFVVLDPTTAELVIRNFQGALTWYRAEPTANVGPAITWYRPNEWQEFSVTITDPEKDGFRIAVPEGAQAFCLQGTSLDGKDYSIDYMTK